MPKVYLPSLYGPSTTAGVTDAINTDGEDDISNHTLRAPGGGSL